MVINSYWSYIYIPRQHGIKQTILIPSEVTRVVIKQTKVTKRKRQVVRKRSNEKRQRRNTRSVGQVNKQRKAMRPSQSEASGEEEMKKQTKGNET